MRRIAFGGIAVLGLLSSTPTLAQASNSVSDAAADTCASVPYSVGDARSTSEIAARLSLSAITKLKTIPNLQGAVGKDVVRSAYAGMRNQAAEAVLDAFRCRVEAHIRKQGTGTQDEQIASLKQAIAGITLDMTIAQYAADSGMTEIQALADAIRRATRAEGDPRLDSSLMIEALKDVEPTTLFINTELKQRWAGLNFGTVLGVDACDAVLRAAISDGGSSIQRSLASLKAILINYLDPNTEFAVAKASIFGNFAIATGAPSVAPASFKACAKDIEEAPVPSPDTIAADPTGSGDTDGTDA